MIKTIYAYIKPTGYIHKEEMEHLLRQQLNVELELNPLRKDLSELTIYGEQDLVASLYAVVKLMESDFGTSILIVMVPTFLQQFIDLIDHSPMKSGVVSAYDLLIKLNYKNTYDFPNIFTNIDQDILDTARAFIECGLNACAASRMLYIHRNTFNYRLKKFIELTNIDIRLVNNAFFVYLFLIR